MKRTKEPKAAGRQSALLPSLKPEHVRVEKMKFAKVRHPETNKSVNDKTIVFYNAHITLRDIPEEAYAYVVNGKPALEWEMERQAVTKDPDSGIINDASLWATETMPPLPPRTLPASHHRHPGDGDDRQQPAEAGHVRDTEPP